MSDTNIEEVSTKIFNAGYDVAFLVPTKTGMEKSIFDAHQSLRSFLKKNNIHDYDTQQQGPKKYIKANYVVEGETIECKVSLYRPETKKGDPRIWIYGLKKLAQPFNLLAFIFEQGELYIINCSHTHELEEALINILPKVQEVMSYVAKGLLDKLVVISAKGFIPTVTAGDTGVGMTLEAELGIAANSLREPDYLGIELKASRVDSNRRQKNKKQLFSKVPNWKLSPVHSAKDLINKRGYVDADGFMALRHTLNGVSPNSLGLFIDIDYANDYLRQMYQDVKLTDINPAHDISWVMEDLRKALLKKHKETFWVKALHNNDRSAEKFHFVEVEHTANPYIDRFETLVETGLLTLDYTMHIKSNGQPRDHGYLFKIKQNSLHALFPKSKCYDLTNMQ